MKDFNELIFENELCLQTVESAVIYFVQNTESVSIFCQLNDVHTCKKILSNRKHMYIVFCMYIKAISNLLSSSKRDKKLGNENTKIIGCFCLRQLPNLHFSTDKIRIV